MVVLEVERLGAIDVMLLVLLVTVEGVYIVTWVTINVKSVMAELESVVMVVLVVDIRIINLKYIYEKHQACLTQSAEYRFCKPKVIGSTPIVGYNISISCKRSFFWS